MKTLTGEKTSISPQIPVSLKERLSDQAKKEMTSQAAIVRKALDDYCQGDNE